MNTPKVIQEKAKELGYTDCSFIGIKKGAKAYLLGYGFKGEETPPIGLPVILLLKDNRVSVVSGLEALDLL